MLAKLKKKLGHNPRLKQQVLHLLVHPVKTRPRRWLRLLQPFYLKRSKGSIIYGNVRKDLVPFNAFQLGAYSVIESFSTINNMVGAVIIGNHSRIGLSNTVIGPVTIGNQVNLAQNIVISGLNHNYRDITQPISKQGVTTIPVTIEDDVWIGANAVILAGITIGKHAVVAAGTVVTCNVPPYSVCAGNPGRIVRQYDFEQKTWIKPVR
ncbi:acyltransferase [Culturomica massiliensis]|jgi:acetyltransferase-like isoleucine patch superfamily enzyme|uniref:acyltransferase n=1 Tax=Culturomica massiliensis TaxID=1841857 RepID=UPI000E55F24B|nr:MULTISPECIES: acyltransferase [Odoribacteraceae]RHV96104.1 acyltransferase [Odoribacter sp. OF09-27XD]